MGLSNLNLLASCGRNVQMETSPCPKCGQEIPSDAVDCPFCGIVVAKFRRTDPPRRESSGAHTPVSESPAQPAVTGALYDPEEPPVFFAAGGAGVGPAPASPHGPVTDAMVEHLSKTAPWVLLMATLLLLGAVVVGFAAILGAGVAGSAGGSSALAFLPGMISAVLYIVFALQLFNFGQAARRVGQGGGTGTIEQALRYQRSFWRLSGVITLVGLGLLVLALGAGILLPLLLGGGGSRP